MSTTTPDGSRADDFRRPRTIRRTAAAFPVRRIGNTYGGASARTLIPGQPILSSVFAGISMFFPPGEQFMIAAAQSVQPVITDQKLLDDLDAFVRQEAQHATEHTQANRDLAASVGLDHKTIAKEIVGLWNWVETHCTPRQRAGFTAATEHFTAIISEVVLRNVGFIDSIPDSKAKQMLVWHAIEECEHKAVMFDAYKDSGGTELERVALMALYVPGAIAAFAPIIRLIVAGGDLANVIGWIRAARVMGPMLPALLQRYAQYYKPGFHPNHLPTRHLELYWRDRVGVVDDGKRTA